MKICYFLHTLNNRTGVGTLTNSIIDGVKKCSTEISYSVLTSEDYLKPSIFLILKNWFYIRGEIKKADIVHAFDGYPYGVLAHIISIGTGKPVIITAIGSGSSQMLKQFNLRAILLQWAYKRSRGVVAISRYVADEIEAVVGISVEVINPGVDFTFWNGNGPSALDSKVDSLRPYFLTQGELKERKGYSVLLPMMKDILENHPSANYVIVANTTRNAKYFGELKNMIEELGLTGRVIFFSDVSAEDLRTLYQKSTGYVLLPQNINGDVEGFGISILEASASGVPVVVGKGSGANDAVEDGKSGFLVDSLNKSEVEGRLTDLLENTTLHTQLSEGAKTWAQKMTWENQAKKYLDLYEKK